MPFWDRSLDLVVLSHAHEDHLAGLIEVLRRYRVDAILDNPYPYGSPMQAQWRLLVKAEGARVLPAMEGQIIRLGDQVTLEVLNPPSPLFGGTSSDVNNNCTVLRLRFGDTSFLLTGDLGPEGEAYLEGRAAVMDTTVLKVAHHGSATSSGQAFLHAVRPRLAVVSVGKGNPYGQPSSEALARLASVVGGSGNVLTTEDHGDIALVSDGRVVKVQTQR